MRKGCITGSSKMFWSLLTNLRDMGSTGERRITREDNKQQSAKPMCIHLGRTLHEIDEKV